MKKLFLLSFSLIALSCYSQSVKKINTITPYISVPYGFGVEAGHKNNIKKSKIDYFAGFSADFGKAASKGSDVLFYAKGVYSVDKFVGLTGVCGIEDLNKFVLGIGGRLTIPSDAFKIVIEPLWRTNGSRVNVGLSFNL